MCPSVQHLLWAWPNTTFCSAYVLALGFSFWFGVLFFCCFFLWGLFSIAYLDALIFPCLRQGSFWIHSLQYKSLQTMSPNCESWNYLWTWPFESEPQTSLITFGDLCTGYHGDENNIWNSSLVYCALAAGMGKQLIMTITETMPKPYIHRVWSAGFLISHKTLVIFLKPCWKQNL